MAKVIKSFIIAFFTAFFTKWLEDFFIFVGVGLIVFTTYKITIMDINILAGNYLLGLVLMLIGILLAKR